MVADIFYPTLTKDHHFSVFYQKKKQNCLGDVHPRVHQGIALGPLGGLQLPSDPQRQLFLALPRADAPIFFLIMPW